MKQITTLTLLTLTLLLSGCQQALQNFEASVLATPAPPTHNAIESSFTPTLPVRQVPLGQETIISSHHRSDAPLSRVELLVNGQPVRGTEDSQNVFPDTLAAVTFCPTQPDVYRFEPISAASPLADVPPHSLVISSPARDANVTVCWQGHIPGTYLLELRAFDKNGRAGNPITQRIEVMATTP